MMKLSHSRAAQGLIALSASFFLIACGGGGDGGGGPAAAAPNVPGTDVPLAATQDSTAAFNFVASIVAKGEADTETPLAVGDAQLATSETADAMPLAA